jgi:hypothetical protein
MLHPGGISLCHVDRSMSVSFDEQTSVRSPASTRIAAQALLQDLKCPIPKTIRKTPSGVHTSSPASNGIAAFAVTASSTRRRYANTSRMRMTKTCRRACTNTSGAQFGSERKSHDLAVNIIVEPEIVKLLRAEEPLARPANGRSRQRPTGCKIVPSPPD